MDAYNRLLVQTEVMSSSSGHCSQDVLSVLNATALAAMVDPTSNLTDMRKAPVLQPDDHDNTHRIDYPESLSIFVGSVVPYIAGFIVRRVELQLPVKSA
ncbi:hypothetical protein MRX96_019971 [Rhipicephalus microplus]